MHTETTALIQAPVPTIFDLAADVRRWPDILPHYRWVRVLEDRGDWRLLDMAARRDAVPVRWRAIQRLLPDVPRILYTHVWGVTKGMAVSWEFQREAGGVRVVIRHDLALRWPMVGRLVADRVVGPVFIQHIAGKTLRRIADIAEGNEAHVQGRPL